MKWNTAVLQLTAQHVRNCLPHQEMTWASLSLSPNASGLLLEFRYVLRYAFVIWKILKKGHTISVSISDDTTANTCYCGTLSCRELHLKMSSEEKVNEIPVRKPGAKKATAKKKSSWRALSLKEKYKVVKAINSGKEQAEVAQLFDSPLSQSTVVTIVRNKKEIIRACEGGLYKDKHKRMKQPCYPDVEKALAEWFKKVRSINVPVNGHFWQRKLSTLQSNSVTKISTQATDF